MRLVSGDVDDAAADGERAKSCHDNPERAILILPYRPVKGQGVSVCVYAAPNPRHTRNSKT